MSLITREVGGRFGLRPLDGVLGDDLKKDLGLTVHQIRAENTLIAFADPVQASKDYQTALDDVMIRAARLYREVGDKAEKAGFPQDQAVTYARDRARDFVAAEMELINLQHPYAESAESLIDLGSGAKRRSAMGTDMKKQVAELETAKKARK